MKIGIMGAMPQEIELVGQELEMESEERIANRTYHIGRFAGADAVVVFSRWGKVAAATTATTLIEHFGVELILFTGVAGGVSEAANVGDVVIADRLIHHDFDVSATGMYAKFEIPLLGLSHFDTDSLLVDAGRTAAEEYLRNARLEHPVLVSVPKVLVGTIASGDQFIASVDHLKELRKSIPNLQAIEMEGAAVAQVCHEYGLPFLVIRTISDNADHNAPTAFLPFVEEVARYYSIGILQELVPMLRSRNSNSLSGPLNSRIFA